jgi:transposase-like protein
METMERKKARSRRAFTRVQGRHRALPEARPQVAHDGLHGWVTTEEKEELSKLRRENRRLREDVEILKRATAFFARRPDEGPCLPRGGKA